jgi:hypothetical protein
LTLNEGDDFSIKDLKGSMVLIHAFGRCTLRVDGYEGYYPNPTHPTTSNRMHGLTIVKADQSTQLYIIGKGGRGPIRCISNAIQSSKQLVIDLRNWVPEPEFYNGKFITLPFTPETDSMYYQKIRAIGRNSENLLTPTN